MQDLDFSGKTVLVTGGGAGIGRAIAEAFAARGAALVVAEIDQQRCSELEAALAEQGIDALVSCTDVCDSAAVNALMQQVQERFGGLDVLVNNVGDFLGIIKPFAACTDEDLERLYAVNLRHIFTVTRAAIPLLQARGKGGSIISISSIEAFRGIPMVTTYCPQPRAGTGAGRHPCQRHCPGDHRNRPGAPIRVDRARAPGAPPALDSAGALRHPGGCGGLRPVPRLGAVGLGDGHHHQPRRRCAGGGGLVPGSE